MSKKASNGMKKKGFTTKIIHSDRSRPIEHGALHEPINTSVAFGYKDARDLARAFQGEIVGYQYGRQGTPTTAALEKQITASIQNQKQAESQARNLTSTLDQAKKKNEEEIQKLKTQLATTQSQSEAQIKTLNDKIQELSQPRLMIYPGFYPYPYFR